MHNYIATFPAGCYDIIARQLKHYKPSELRIAAHDESSVHITASLRSERLVDMRFFTNVFLVLDEQLSHYKQFIKGDAFRLMALRSGEPVAIESAKRQAIARRIQHELGLQPASVHAQDFVLMHRKGTDELLTLRLPRAKHKREPLQAGALRPELAHILLLVAGVKPKDTVLDPFAGYGSITHEAARGFGVKHIIGIEKDPALANLYGAQPGDATDLINIASSSVDRIVTDPPWGLFASVDKTLYAQALLEMHRVLKHRGVAVVLSGSSVLDTCLRQSPYFLIIKSYSVLVSGKKAIIFKLQPKAGVQ